MKKEKKQDFWPDLFEKLENENIHWNARDHRRRTLEELEEFCGYKAPSFPKVIEFIYKKIKIDGRTRWGVSRIMQDVNYLARLKKIEGKFNYAIIEPPLVLNSEIVIQAIDKIQSPSVAILVMLICCGIDKQELEETKVKDYNKERGVLLEKYKLPYFARERMDRYLDPSVKLNLDPETPLIHKSERDEDGIRRPETQYMYLKQISRASIFSGIDIRALIRKSKKNEVTKKDQLIRYCSMPR